MKNILTIVVMLISITISAQVGINNTSPKATLDITAKTSGTKPEGLIIPQLSGDNIHTATATAVYGAAQKGLIVYASSADTNPTGATVNITAAGYYYFDGSAWQRILETSSGDTTNDGWVNDTTNSMVKLGAKADGTARAAATDFVVKDDGKVGIGTSAPSTNLDVIGSEIRLRGGDNPVLRIHSAANEVNKGGSIEFNENGTNWGMRIRHSTGSDTSTTEGMIIESKISGVYSPILTLDETTKFVGIGTTTPKAALHLLNSARFELPHRMKDRVLKTSSDNGDLYWAPSNTNYGAGASTTITSLANGASATYTFANTKGMVRIATAISFCGRYWQKDFDFDTTNSTIAFITGSGVGNPDGGGSETMTSNSSYNLTGSMILCADSSYPGLPATITISGNTLTITNNSNVARNYYITEFPYLSPMINLYTENGSLSSNRTVNLAANTLAFNSSATTGTSHFSVDGSTFSVDAVNNRVGIGTIATVPKANLHVSSPAGQSTPIAAFSIVNCGSGCSQGTAKNIVLNNIHTNNSLFASIDFVPGGDPTDPSGASIQGIDRDFTNNYAGLSFFTRNATDYDSRMVIKSSGNVGIGTSAPATTLTVNGIISSGVQNISTAGTAVNRTVVSATTNFVLPSAVTNPGAIIFTRNINTSGSITVTTAGGNMFNGGSTASATSYAMNATDQTKSIIWISDGINWTAMTSNF